MAFEEVWVAGGWEGLVGWVVVAGAEAGWQGLVVVAWVVVGCLVALLASQVTAVVVVGVKGGEWVEREEVVLVVVEMVVEAWVVVVRVAVVVEGAGEADLVVGGAVVVARVA